MSIYDRLRPTASRLLRNFKQGQIQYRYTGEPTGDPWAPVPGAAVTADLDATANGVAQEYVDGSLVLATDLQVTAAVFGVVPTLSGELLIDGKTMQIVRVIPLPAAGSPVAWRLIVRA